LIEEELTIKGIEVSYYIVCKRNLWLFSHGIDFERFSDDVEIGKIISELRKLLLKGIF
jgi:CRISPR-associated exonuclease Cas4